MSKSQTFTIRKSTNLQFEVMASFDNDQILRTDKFRPSKNPDEENLSVPVYEYIDEAEKLVDFLTYSNLKEDVDFVCTNQIIYFNFSKIENSDKEFELAYLLAGENTVETIQNYLLIEESKYDDCSFTIDDEEYLVFDNSEMNTRFRERCINLVEGCYTCDFPEPYKAMAEDCFIEALVKEEERGSALAAYDGLELKSENFYIYRNN